MTAQARTWLWWSWGRLHGRRPPPGQPARHHDVPARNKARGDADAREGGGRRQLASTFAMSATWSRSSRATPPMAGVTSRKPVPIWEWGPPLHPPSKPAVSRRRPGASRSRPEVVASRSMAPLYSAASRNVAVNGLCLAKWIPPALSSLTVSSAPTSTRQRISHSEHASRNSPASCPVAPRSDLICRQASSLTESDCRGLCLEESYI